MLLPSLTKKNPGISLAAPPLWSRGSSWLILFAGPLLFWGFSSAQVLLLGIDKPVGSHVIPGGIGLLTGLLVAILWHRLQVKREKEKRFFMELVEVLAVALDERDQYTHGHARRVTTIALQLGAAVRLASAEMELLRLSGILHDIGKIGIPDLVLLKPGPLTQEEFALVKAHPEKGARILGQLHSAMIAGISSIIKHHHERFDGKGYPAGLAGQNIPLLSRIMAIADTYDAMTSDRPYRGGMAAQDALGEIRNGAGTQFDPELVARFLELYEKQGQEQGIACDAFSQCEIFSLIQDDEISKAYAVQYCCGNYLACERHKIKNKKTQPANLLPDGRLLCARNSR